jgi:inosose dehydratase
MPEAWRPPRNPLRGPVGIVPLSFANDDLPDLTPPIDGVTLLDEIARLGFEGLQLSRVLPRGDRLREELSRRGLRIAEVYAVLPCAADGPPEAAVELGRSKIRDLEENRGEVLILSYHLSPGRAERAGRADGPVTPRLTARGFERAVEVLHRLASEARERDHLVVYHPHVGSYVETPGEIERLMAATDPELLGLCIDTGHYTVGGGDPAQALQRYGRRVQHLHIKDVDASVLEGLRTGRIATFLDSLRERLFTELGSGVVDVGGIAGRLLELDYAGWIMCEQDTSWLPAAESAAISRRVWAFALDERSDSRR